MTVPAKKPAAVVEEPVVDDDLSFGIAFGGPEQEVEDKPVVEETDDTPVVEETDDTLAVEETDDTPEQAPEPELDPLKVLSEDVKAVRKKLETPAEPVKPEPAKPEPAKPEPAPPVLSDDEQEFIDNYRSEWPEADRALAIQRKLVEAEMSSKVEKIINERMAALKPFIQQSQETAQDRFIRTVTAAHADAAEILPKVEQWIPSLPPAMRASYSNILDHGTADDVIALFGHYKTLHPSAQPAQAPAATPKTLPDAKKKKIDKMEDVSSARQQVEAEDDPNDFDAAFRQ